MNDKKDITLDATSISEREKYFNPDPISKEEMTTPSMPNPNLFEELLDGCQINEFGEIVREKGKSR